MMKKKKLIDNNIDDLRNNKKSIILKEEKKKKIYVGYIGRLIINLFIFIIASCISLYFIFSSFSIIKAHIVTYQESSDIDYRVYLKENNFYDKEYLEKNMSYISTLIDKVNATFIYNFDINENTNIDFNYNIVGKLIIMDSTGKNNFYQKDYTLLESKKAAMDDDRHYSINENLDIDYSYYNSIANDFRNKFGVSTTSNFIVTLKVIGTSSNNDLNIDSGKEVSLTIPLSQREVNIKLETDTLNNNHSIVKDSHLEITNNLYLIIALISLVLSIISLIKLIKKIIIISPSKSNYDKHISKILKEYDRFIANTTTGPIVGVSDKVIEINDFQELLDVRDSLKVPINYYNIVNHQKCLFYLHKDNLIYEYYVKANKLNDEKK